MTAFLQPHRLVFIALAALLVLWCATALRWDWLPAYGPLLLQGLWTTAWLLVATITITDIYAVSSPVRQDLLIVYEPLLLLAVCYVAMAGLIALIFARFEQSGPGRVRR